MNVNHNSMSSVCVGVDVFCVICVSVIKNGEFLLMCFGGSERQLSLIHI